MVEKDAGMQVPNTLLKPTEGGSMNVLLTNCLGLSQIVEKGTKIGTP